MSFSNTTTPGNADPYTAKNADEPDLKTKIEALLDFADAQKFCLLTTRIASSGLLVSRAMALAGKENHGADLIFHTNTESGKTDDLAKDSDINLGFIAPSGEWASIAGRAEVVTDRATVQKHYSPALKAWLGDLGDGKHDGGPEDPRIGVIKVHAVTAQYSIKRKSTIGAVIDVAKGAVTGEVPQINKMRHIEETEFKQWRASGSA